MFRRRRDLVTLLRERGGGLTGDLVANLKDCIDLDDLARFPEVDEPARHDEPRGPLPAPLRPPHRTPDAPGAAAAAGPPPVDKPLPRPGRSC